MASRSSVKTSLTASFLAVTGLVVVSSLLGFHASRVFEDTLNEITAIRLPPMILSQQLAVQSERIVASVPALIASLDETERAASASAIAAETRILSRLASELRRHSGSAEAVKVIEARLTAFMRDIHQIDHLIQQRLALVSQERRGFGELRRIHNALIEIINPAISVARAPIDAFGDAQPKWGGGPAGISGTLSALMSLSETRMLVYELTNLLLSVTTETDVERLYIVGLKTRSRLADIQERIGHLNPEMARPFAGLMQDLKDYAVGAQSLTDQRLREIEIVAEAHRMTMESRRASSELNAAVQDLIAETKDDVGQAARNAKEAQKKVSGMLILAAAASVIFSALMGWRYVGRRVIRPIEKLAEAARAIEAGEAAAEPAIEGDDEIANLARAFSRMVKKRDAAEKSLREAHDALEQRVRDRTAELLQKNQELTREMQERERTEAALCQARDQAEAASRAKSLFLANMSHEIRTPIHAMDGFARILLAEDFGPLNDRQSESVNHIVESTRKLLYLINDILDLSRVEAGKIELNVTGVAIRQLMKGLVDAASGPAMRKKIPIGLSVDPDVPEFILADGHRLEQVLRNLIDNAVKFTEKGRIAVAVGRSAADELLFTVTDTGIGIPAEYIGQLFDAFYQVDGSYAKKFTGAGLGLAITRRLLEIMEGRIWVDSALGQGSTFSVTIPFRPPQPMASPALRANAPEPPPARTALRVLLAEDEDLNRMSLTHFLEKAGHQVTGVPNGIAALKSLEAEAVDIILMDIQMPELDGVETTRRIRSDQSGRFDPATPIIALTAFALKGDREAFLEAGMDDYVSKPMDVDDLLNRMNQLCARRKTPDPRKTGGNGDPESFKAYIRAFIASTAGDPDVLSHILETFPAEASDRMANLHAAWESNDPSAVALAAHRVTNLFSAIFIRAASDISRELEAAAREGRMTDCAGLLAGLDDVMRRVVRHLTEGISEPGNE